MAVVAKLETLLTADTRDFDQGLDRSHSKMGKFSGLVKAGAIGAGAAIGVGLFKAAKLGFGEFQQGQKVAAQTAAVLKSTGGAAHVTAGQISGLATSLMKKSGVDDEAIASGENLLLTFTNIRNEAGKNNDVFTRATKVALDMSVALGQDLKSSNIQLGKALNDPIKGITALQRVGVSFTEGQKKQIKALVESGNTLGAQKLILRELNKEFGGSAKAAGETLPGQINILKERFNNFAGDLVAKAIPAINQTIQWLRDHWPEISAKIQAFWQAVQPTLQALIDMAVAIVTTIRDHWGTIGPIVTQVAKVIKDQLKIITDALKLVTALIRGDWGEAWKQLKNLVRDTLNSIKDRIILAKQILVATMKGLGTAMKDAAVDALKGIAGAAWNVISGIGDKIAGAAKDIAGWGKTLGGKLLKGILDGLEALPGKLVSLLKSAVNGLIDRINSLFDFDASVKVLGKKVGVHVDLPDIPHLAQGVRGFSGGLAMVGEKGPELVSLPRGASVTPNHALAASGDTYVFPIQIGDKTVATVIFDALRQQAKVFRGQNGRSPF